MSKGTVFAKNFRGFEYLFVDLDRSHFLVGDNSSGKSSAIHLVDCVLRSQLKSIPALREGLGVSAHDYFSPFFDYEDVTFGFAKSTSSSSGAKLITLKRGKDILPAPVIVSYVADGRMYSIKKSSGKLKLRIHDCDGTSPSELIRLHLQTTGYTTHEDNTPPEASILEPGLFFVALTEKLHLGKEVSSQTEASMDLFVKVMSLSMPTSVLIGPVRSLPARFYELRRTRNSGGKHFAEMLLDIKKDSFSEITDAITRFGRESGLFENLHVRKVNKKIADAPLVVTAERAGREFFINQLGVGLSQVVPILTEAVFAAARPQKFVFLVQQPELHLHPIAQAALGSFLYSLNKFGLTSVSETHSSFMMDRYRSEMRDDADAGVEPSGNPLRILFAESTKSGNRVVEVTCTSRGEISEAPEQYYSFFISETIRTMI